MSEAKAEAVKDTKERAGLLARWDTKRGRANVEVRVVSTGQSRRLRMRQGELYKRWKLLVYGQYAK